MNKQTFWESEVYTLREQIQLIETERNNLERENVALRADKERLDWLALSPDKRLLTVHGLWVNDGDVADMRAAIDRARKEQP